MYLTHAPTFLTLLYLLASTTASPYPLKPRQPSDAYPINDPDLYSLCVDNGDNAACKELDWSPKVVAYLKNSEESDIVGSTIQPSNSTAPPANQPDLGKRRDDGTVKRLNSSRDYERYLKHIGIDTSQSDDDSDESDTAEVDKGDDKVGSSINVPLDEEEQGETSN